jgi:hypothetical protein
MLEAPPSTGNAGIADPRITDAGGVPRCRNGRDTSLFIVVCTFALWTSTIGVAGDGDRFLMRRLSVRD